MSQDAQKRFWITVVCSALIHVLVLQTQLRFPDREEEPKDPIVVENWTKERRRAVRSTRNPNTEAFKDKKARFGDTHKNRVEKETRAPLTGRYYEGRSRPIVPDQKEGDRQLHLSDLLGLSSQPHKLPEDIEIGPQTSLNTDPVLYASFSHRISDEIYSPWVRLLRQAIEALKSKGRTLETNAYITKLKVVFTQDGAIQKIQTLKGSGIDALDTAARNAFWETEPFPNPPKLGLEADDTLNLVYEFQLNWKTGAFRIRS